MIEKVPKSSKGDVLKSLKLLDDPEMVPLLRKINGEYAYWDKVKYLAPKGGDAKSLWNIVKISRSLNAVAIPLGKYKFSFTITENMLAMLHEFDMNLGGNLGTQNIIPERDKSYFLLSSVMEEAIASSQMEGASTTRKVAKEMLRKQEKPKNKSQQMISNNYATIRYLVEHQQDNFSVDKLLYIHKLITNKTLDNSEDEGKLRTDDSIRVMDGITGEIAHTPPSHALVKTLLTSLCNFANEDNQNGFIHPIIKGIIIHFMLAYIHPFVDGNGRTARSLVYWYFIKKGYWLTEYLSISRVIYKDKKQYEKAFLYTENDDNDLSYFIQFNLNVMEKAFEELKLYLQRKIAERDGVLLLKGVEGINERQAHILKILSEKANSVFTTKEIISRFGVTGKTARADLQGLVSRGFMEETSLNKRTMGYTRARDFDVVMRKAQGKIEGI